MKSKRGILYWLRVVLAICCLGWFCYRCVNEITAFAAHPSGSGSNSEYVDLTPAQTLALYGDTINGLLYLSFNDMSPVSIQFQYAFPLSSIGNMDSDSGFGFDYTTVYNAIAGEGVGRELEANYIANTNGLVYIASSSQWGGTKVSPFHGAPNVQLHCTYGVALNGIAGIRQAIHYSVFHPSLPSQAPLSSSNYAIYTCSDDNIQVYSMGSGVSQRSAVYTMPAYPFYNSAPLDESQVLNFSGFYVDTDALEDPFNCTGITLDCNGITSTQTNSNDLYIIVQCPRLWAYEPPVITTTRPAETIPAATYPVETMPPDVTDVPLNVINQNLVTNNYQLNLIIGQLNLIYAELKAQGELGLKVDLGWDPDLEDGESITFYGTDIDSQMQNIMTTYTLSGNPELNDNNNFVKYAFMSFFSENWLAGLGLFALGLSLATWIIFNGRGS